MCFEFISLVFGLGRCGSVGFGMWVSWGKFKLVVEVWEV